MIIKGNQYKSIIDTAKKCAAAPSTRDLRMTGIYVRETTDRVEMFALDEHRGVKHTINGEGTPCEYVMPIINIPCKSDDDVQVKKEDDCVSITVLNDHMTILKPILGDNFGVDVDKIFSLGSDEDFARVTLNPKYLKDAMMDIDSRRSMIKIHVNKTNPLAPVRISAKSENWGYESVILPIRVKEGWEAEHE